MLDGRLDDRAWAAATPITSFTQQKPSEGQAASERTEVRILYDDEAIYLGARMYGSHGAAGVTSRLTRRDDDPQSDILRIDFDPYHTRLHSVEFDINPAGWKGDAADGDRSWDPVWQAKTRVDSAGWTAELRIPFSQLSFSRDSVQTWGFNLTRTDLRAQERDLWAYWSQKESGGPAFFGDLVGMRIHRAPEHAELLPYIVTRTQRLTSGDARDPFYRPHQSDVRFGGDFKYQLNRSFALSATVNPDFGQVEVDPAEVNLSAFESYFEEKRPFFVAGSDIFGFGSPGCNINCPLGLNLFYSRRIGRAPQASALAYGAGEYSDVPQSTAILGAAKLIGRTSHGLSVGVLDALTRRELADVADADGRLLAQQTVEPRTNSFVGRVKQELRGGNLVLGAMLTGVNRAIGDGPVKSLLPVSSQSAGADVEAFWGQHAYHFYAAASASRVAGDSLAILRLQRSSARYFQRPDRTTRGGGLFSSAYDSGATALVGNGAIVRLEKSSGSWIWDLNAASVSPGFETNDLGFQTNADYRWVNGTIGRQYTTPTTLYRRVTFMGGAEHYWNFDGDPTGRDAVGLISTELPSYWNVTALVMRTFSAFDDRKARGGPVLPIPAATMWFTQVATDPRRKAVLNGTLNVSSDEAGGYSKSISLGATLRPVPNVRITVGPGFMSSRTSDQYVKAVVDPTATAFGGSRYVFSRLDQRQLYMSTRANVTFTPALSLEMFAQPLIASGDYFDFEEFAAPRSLEKRVYGRDVGTVTTSGSGGALTYAIDPDGAGPATGLTVRNPDFNFRSLRGTGVLRWEWRPGSTAYFVWTQSRSGTAPLGDLDFSRDRSALLDAPADNIFVMKISYLFGM